MALQPASAVKDQELPRLLADQLWRAEFERAPLPVETAPRSLSRADGLAVQHAGFAARRKAGEKHVGYKVGLSSPDPQHTFDYPLPVAGHLFERHIVQGETVRSDRFMAPRLEPEIAFIVGPAGLPVTERPADITDAFSHVAPALEIVGSRWSPRPPSLGHLLADNVSAAGVLLGARRSLDDLDPAGLAVEISVGTRSVSGQSTNVLGDPVRALDWLVDHVAGQGRALQAGQIVITGTWCAPISVDAGDRVVADFGPLGICKTVFVE